MAKLGKKALLIDIDDNRVAALMARRRSEFRQVGKVETRTQKVSAATVNRTFTEPQRKVLLRAAKVWKVRVADIDWGSHMLDEPQERVRDASKGEDANIVAKLERGFDDAVEFAFINGCRRMEIGACAGRWWIFFGRQFTVIGKGGKSRTIPMNKGPPTCSGVSAGTMMSTSWCSRRSAPVRGIWSEARNIR